MAVCTYDNPVTMQREIWLNKSLVHAISRYAISDSGIINTAANWAKGQIVGDPKAIGKRDAT